MLERNGAMGGHCGKQEQLCCVSVDKVFDSARDKDCLEDVRVHLCDMSQEIIDRSSAVRCKNVEVMNTNINIEPVPFNRGFYQVTIRYYFCVTLEACVCGGRVQEVKGLAAFDKKIILYGSEKNVSVFTSDPEKNCFCFDEQELKCDSEPTLPKVVVEVASPICLDSKLVERSRRFGNCCLCIDAIPEPIKNCFEGCFVDNVGANNVYVTIGVFSVIRMERKVQLMLPACHFCLPEKDSKPGTNDDPCSIFGKMQFPVGEFYPYADDQCIVNDRCQNQSRCESNNRCEGNSRCDKGCK